ncbi:MAG: phosphoribosylglycinamide formyltransferase [Thermaerobacter sp.]|nr:phosphoribosylglycinamide formyltransferase [Thermaerobacter sp.]
MTRVAVLVSGRGSNLRAILEQSRAPGFPARVVAAVSDRGEVLALEHARSAGVEALALDAARDPSWDAHLAAVLEERRVDLICLAGYMRLVREPLLSRFAGRILNIHPSLLPAFPGLDAQRQAWEYGVKVAGCTVHFVDAGMDAGPVVLQRSVPVAEDDTPESLAERILREEHRAYPEAVRLFALGRLELRGRRVLVRPQ